MQTNQDPSKSTAHDVPIIQLDGVLLDKVDYYLLDPVAKDGTPAQAFASHRTRVSAIARQYALENPLKTTGGTVTATEDNTMQLIAHMQAAFDDPKVPGYELSGSLARKALKNLNKGEGKVGTSFDVFLSSRPGDYDMALKGLMVIAYRYRRLLTDSDLHFLLDELVPSELVGANITDFEAYRVLGSRVPETENHMLMISSTVYLVNQLFLDRTGDLKYSNRRNGLAKWLLEYMHTIARHDFLEFNSRPYQRLSLHALFNLYEFARDRSVRTAAQILLDYIMVKFAVSSNRQRRICPFRRLKENTNRPDNHNDLLKGGAGADALVGFFLMYAGPTDSNGNPINMFPKDWAIEALIAGLTTYRPAPAAYMLAMKRDIPAYQHRFYHGERPQFPAADEPVDGGVEIYYNSPSFLLTAGGMFLNSGYGRDEFVDYEQTAIAQSTTLLPTRGDFKFADLIRFDPYPNEREAVNTAVHMGFACGANLRLNEKKTLNDTTLYAPALASHSEHLFLSWQGTGNENLNAAKVYTTEMLPGIGGLKDKVALGETSGKAPALASHKGRLFLAWKGAGNDHLNLRVSNNSGASFQGKMTFSEISPHAPAIASHNGQLFIAWTGTGNGNLNIAKVVFFSNTQGGGIKGLKDKVDLGNISEQAPALVSHSGRLYLAWKEGDNDNDNLVLMFSDNNGASFHGKMVFSESSPYAPALASHNGKLFIAWAGTGDGNLSIAKVLFFSDTQGGSGILGLEHKVVLNDTSGQAPALGSHKGRLFLAWKRADSENLNLLSSQDGFFQAEPWYFSDQSKLGFHVVAYRTTPGRSALLLDAAFHASFPLESLGLVYAMEAGSMSFETFKQLTLKRNTALPTKLDYDEPYTFHTADNHRFSFSVNQFRDKYQARIVRMDEVNLVANLTSLPLIEGPYLRAPNGHNGYIEIRHPGCEGAPLVLDFRDPEKPIRLDNLKSCPKPWLDRAQALLKFARRLAKAKKHREEIEALNDRVTIYRQLVEVDPVRYGPDLASAQDLLKRR